MIGDKKESKKKLEKLRKKLRWFGYICVRNEKLNNMSKQAENSLTLYKGGNPSTIEQLLKMQSPSVVNELKEHFNTTSLSELAVKLSRG